MSQVLVTESYLDDIADAIRDKNGSEDTYTPAQMAGAIDDIQTADEVVLVSKSVNANGTYNPASDSADGYSGVTVNVPNTYTASDEGKVVSSGNLVSQSSKSITQNGTHDTTMNNSVSVDVPNSYSASDNGKVVVNQALTDQTSKSINVNGTHDTTANNSVVVDVPNSYAAADEGKVVSGGALVGQTSKTITNNGTYDTTKNNSVVVNVSGGSGSIVNPDFQGLTYMYVNSRGEQIYISSQKNQYLNVFSVMKNHKYALFIGEIISTRRRAGFFEIDASQLEQYYNQYASTDTLLFSGGIWIAPYSQGTDDTGHDLKARSIITVPENGVILYGTSNNYTIAPAYCIDIT